MTASELIVKLTAHDRCKVVVCHDDDGRYYNIQNIKDNDSEILVGLRWSVTAREKNKQEETQ